MEPKSSSARLAEAMERTRRRWLAQTRAETDTLPPLAPAPPAFTIAISREAGASGPTIARAVGEKLGWPVYDRELLQQIAEEMGLRTSLLKSVDEKRKGWFQGCLDKIFSVPTVNESQYFRHLTETLLSLAAHGECVIVGRGAAQLLPAATTLRVRLVGPVAERTEAIMGRFDLSRDEAARWIEKTDAERNRFVRDHVHKDPSDARLYDLVLNSQRFSVAECADLIIEALHRLQAHASARPPKPDRLQGTEAGR
jgi:cytidylate kinase